MEKAEQQWEQEGEEEEEEAEEGLQGRRSRNQSNSTTDISTSNGTTTTTTTSMNVSNCDEIQSSVPSNGVEDSSLVHQEAAEELKISSDVQRNSEKCVYYDDDKGIWKCRNCCWTYASGSVCIEHIQNPNQHLHKLMNVKTENQQGPCFIHETKGTRFTYGFSVTEHSSIEFSAPDKNPGDDGLDVTAQSFDIGKSLSTLINHQYEEILNHNSLPGSSLHPSEISFEERNTSYETFSNKAIETADNDLIREINDEVTELDVERVLEKQDTHDLYCPNCNSCITRRVILRKRKRKIRTYDEDKKRNKLESVIDSDLDGISVDATSKQTHNSVDIGLYGNLPPASTDNDRDREPHMFGCLSCFSIFIPTGNGFKLFRVFGDKSDKKNMQDPQQTQAMKKNWFSSIFASDKEVLIEQGTSHSMDVEKNNVGLIIPSSNLNGQNGEATSIQEAPSPAQTFDEEGRPKSRPTEPQGNGDNILPSTGQAKHGKVMVDVGEKLDDAINKIKGGAAVDYSEANNMSSTFFIEKLFKHDSDHPETTVAGKTPDEKTILLSPTPVSVLGELDTNSKVNISAAIPRDYEQNVGAAFVPEFDIGDGNEKVQISDKDGAYPEISQHNIVRTKVDIHSEKLLEVDGDFSISSVQDALFPQEGHVSIGKDMKDMPAESNANGTYRSEISQHNTIRTKVDIHTETLLKVDRDVPIPTVHDDLLLQEERVTVDKNLKDMTAVINAGKDTIINVETGQVEPAIFQRAQNIDDSAETEASPLIETRIPVVERKGTTSGEVRGVDIIKSIVYGGLVESITSLGVVSSAAGADASTLNVLALGLANLIGGLFVIGHDLWELKNSHIGGASDQVAEQVDRYQELLGRKSDFLLHAIVAVLSYLTFGLLSPVIYGFSFRKSDDRDFKLVAVALASLLCIIILAIGKAYVRRPPKSYLKTAVYYVAIGFMVSGASFVVGSLIKKLLEKLGWFDPNSVVNVPFSKTRSMNPAWASY